MLNRLVLNNVRRHARTEIDFDADAQLIALAGLNGAGKSTILEAILYALYGETRHGRAGIADMVRRGAEHEGMEVQLSFTVAGVPYEVTRRYEKGKSTASLTASGKEIMRSVAAVNNEVAKILGMDAAGFKLATIAKQKELDGLADLSPAKRRAAVGRLMRLDALAAAARKAREEFNECRAVSLELSRHADVHAAQAAETAATSAANEAAAAYEAQAEVLARLDESFRATRDVAERWEQCMLKVAEYQGQVDVLTAQLVQAESEAASVVVPDELPRPSRQREEVESELASLTAHIARGEAVAAVAEQRRAVEGDLKAAQDEYNRLASQEVELSGSELELEAANRVVEELTAASSDAEEAHNTATSVLARLEGEVFAARALLDSASELDSVCPVCSQSVSEDVRNEQLRAARETVTDIEAQIADAQVKKDKAGKEVSELRSVAAQAHEAARQARRRCDQHAQVRDALERVEKSIRTYTSTLERLEVVDVDLDELYVRKARVDGERALLGEWDANVADRAAKIALVDQLSAAATNISDQLTQATARLAAAQPDEDLTEAMQARERTAEEMEAERAMLVALGEAESVARTEQARATSALEAARSAAERVREYQGKAQVASKTAQVLNEAAKRLSLETRPYLESELASLLYALSEGRFTAVKVSEEYEVSVQDDDGKFYSVSEFSGGEADLIALAVRLALAQAVSKRHGADTAGFLILDEVLGSQDAARRSAILEGLRRLRGVYGQILLISHVGGLEDAADRVLTVEVEDGVSVAG